MNLTAPSAPSALDVADAPPRDIDDAVITEARRRARRRRRTYAGLLAAVLVGAAAFVMLGRSGSSPSPAPAGALTPPPQAVPGDGQPPRLIAHFGAVHGGWALVYSDGLVLVKPDAAAGAYDSFGQRHLSEQGMLLVRSGALHPKALLTDWPLLQSANLWAEPGSKPYPTTWGQPGAPGYVACVITDGREPRVRPELATQLPARAFALTRGTQRTFQFLPYQALMHSGGGLSKETIGAPIPQECFELDVARARALTRLALPAAFHALDSGDTVRHSLNFTGRNGGHIGLELSVALPDRVIVATGG